MGALVGMPDYDAYLAHIRAHHPDRAPMTRQEFFRNRQEARYGKGSGGKCC
ncbi:MAG: YbdD/YjiX family protein [Novosphingobium sp.]|nr:YbdD/YjiX family protein [Novosphingobium sp.]